jgi:hypothetical protein
VHFVDDARALINGGNFHRFNILNLDEIWVIHLQKVDTLLMIGI